MANENAHAANPRGGRSRHRVRGRQAAKRATFPFINSQLVSVAETGDLGLFISTIETYVQEMNLVNISTAMHRLAKLTSNDAHKQLTLRQHPVLPALLTAALALLERAREGNTSPHCQALSNITWALATVQYVDLPLLAAVAELSKGRIPSFKPFELSATLWAFAKLETLDPAVRHCSEELFSLSAQYIPANVEAFTFRCLVMTVWAFATARHHDSSLFMSLGDNMLPTVHTANCQELANTVWAFSTAGVRHEALLAALAAKAFQCLGDFKQQDLSSTLWGFAASGYYHEEFFINAAQAVQFLELQPQQMANILWAFSRLRPRQPELLAAVLSLLPRCSWMAEAFKPPELASAALAAAKCFGRQSAGVTRRDPLSLPQEVANFFLAARAYLDSRMRVFSGQSLANLAWAFVQVGQEPEPLVRIAGEAERRAAELAPTALVLLLRCLPLTRSADCDAPLRSLFAEAERKLADFRPREMQVLSRVCAELLGPQSGLGASATVDQLRKSCQTLCQAEGLASSGEEGLDQRDEALLAAGDPPEDEQAAGLHANSACRSGSNESEGRPEGRAQAAPAAGPPGGGSASAVLSNRVVQYSVKNTFLHVDDEAQPDSEEDEEDPARHLPPSLGFIPNSVSPERLAAYRADYQRFRAGKAVGAKGELGRSVVPEYDEFEQSAEMDDEVESSAATSTAPHSSSSPGRLGPPLHFMPKYISPQKLEAYRADYQSFRAGNTRGAKGEIANRVAQDELPPLPAMQLPPPLDIIPSNVSPEKLAEYRLNYLRFRAGNAQGAKGEVASAVAPDEPHFIALDKLACGLPKQDPTGDESNASKSTADDGNKPESQVAVAVKNTFLHFEEACEGLEDSGAEARLPPPLKIIPGNISAEKLEAYRMDYQKFRAGNATGAKGEVSSTVGEDGS